MCLTCEAKLKHQQATTLDTTTIAQSSLGGNTKTVMIANCGPANYNTDETLSTLRYADRAKQIQNRPNINEDPEHAMIREYQEEIERLRAQMAEATKSEVRVNVHTRVHVLPRANEPLTLQSSAPASPLQNHTSLRWCTWTVL